MWSRPSGVISARATILLMVVLAGCRQPDAQRNRAAIVTFNRDVAPILFEHCSGCHRPGQAAPFSVLEYREVKPNARRVAAATRSREMPPWLPEPNHGDFLNPRPLRADQIETIEKWVNGGAPEGDPADLPRTPKWTDRWQLGTPDLVVEMPQPYSAHSLFGQTGVENDRHSWRRDELRDLRHVRVARRC
jgi:hypothetical protein